MERLLALKEIPLFKNLSLDQLEAVHQITKEVEYLPGEVILKQGERGDELYLLIAGPGPDLHQLRPTRVRSRNPSKEP